MRAGCCILAQAPHGSHGGETAESKHAATLPASARPASASQSPTITPSAAAWAMGATERICLVVQLEGGSSLAAISSSLLSSLGIPSLAKTVNSVDLSTQGKWSSKLTCFAVTSPCTWVFTPNGSSTPQATWPKHCRCDRSPPIWTAHPARRRHRCLRMIRRLGQRPAKGARDLTAAAAVLRQSILLP